MNNLYYRFDSTFKEKPITPTSNHLIHAKISLVKEFFAYMMCEKMKKANAKIYGVVSGTAALFTADNPATIKLELEKVCDEHDLHWAVVQDIFKLFDSTAVELELSNLDGKPLISTLYKLSDIDKFMKKMNTSLAKDNISLELQCGHGDFEFSWNEMHRDPSVVIKTMVMNTGSNCNLLETIREHEYAIGFPGTQPVRLVFDHICVVDGNIKSEEIIECETSALSWSENDHAILPMMINKCFETSILCTSTQFFCETNFYGHNIFVHVRSNTKKGEEQTVQNKVHSVVGRMKNFFKNRNDWAYTNSKEEFLKLYNDCCVIDVILKTNYDVDMYVTQLLIKEDMIKYYAKAFEIALGDDCDHVSVAACAIICYTNGNRTSDGRYVFDLPYTKRKLEDSVKTLVEMERENRKPMENRLYRLKSNDLSCYEVRASLPVTESVYFKMMRHIFKRSGIFDFASESEMFQIKNTVEFIDALVVHRHAVNAIYDFLCTNIVCYIEKGDQSTIPIVSDVPNFKINSFIRNLKYECQQKHYDVTIEKRMIPKECWMYAEKPVVVITCSPNFCEPITVIGKCVDAAGEELQDNTYRAVIHLTNFQSKTIDVMACEIGKLSEEQAKEFILYFESVLNLNGIRSNVTLEGRVYRIELETDRCIDVSDLAFATKTICRIRKFFENDSDATLRITKNQYALEYRDRMPVNVYIHDKQSGIVYLCNTFFLKKEGFKKYFDKAFKEYSDKENIGRHYGHITVTEHGVGDVPAVRFDNYESSFSDGERLASHVIFVQELIDHYVEEEKEAENDHMINIYVQCFPSYEEASRGLFKDPSSCPDIQLDLIPEFGCFADNVVQLEEWIAGKEDIYHVAQKSYQKHDSGPDYLFYNIWSDTATPKHMESVFETRVRNFMTLLEIKSATEKEMSKVTYEFSDADTPADVIVHASIVCKNGQKYFFIDEAASEANKGNMKDYVKSYFNTESESIKIFETPKFILDLIKENIPEIKIDER